MARKRSVIVGWIVGDDVQPVLWMQSSGRLRLSQARVDVSKSRGVLRPHVDVLVLSWKLLLGIEVFVVVLQVELELSDAVMEDGLELTKSMVRVSLESLKVIRVFAGHMLKVVESVQSIFQLCTHLF